MTRDGFHKDLREIEEAVIQMAALVEAEIALAMQALSKRDVNLAQEVVTRDGEVNALQRDIRTRCTSLIALQAPVARDLRELVTVQLVISELERMGDHAVGVAKQSLRLQEFEPLPLLVNELVEMARLARNQVREGIQAFVDVNVQLARAICAKDDEIDQRYRMVFTNILTAMTNDPSIIKPAASLLFVAHDIERIADRVTNICEDVIYMVSGEVEELN